MLLGFCEDYRRVVINARHELILIRSRNDNNCLIGDPTRESEIVLFKVQWRMPHVSLNKINKLSMLRALESGWYLSMAFRSWELYELPLLHRTTKHSWSIKTATQLEKPRYVIFTLQAGQKNIMSEDTSRFDHCKLNNVKLWTRNVIRTMIWIWISIKTDRFSIAHTHVSVKTITDTIILSRIKLSRLFGYWTTRLCIASLYTIAWFSTIRWPTLCAKLPKCDTTLFPEDDIKIYDASKSTAIFSRTQSCLYQYLWICMVSSLEDILLLRSLLLSKRDMFFLIIFLDDPYCGVASPKRKVTRRCDWLRIDGIQWEDGMVPYCMARSLITKTVMGTTTHDDDDDIVVKGYEKREWLQDLLLAETMSMLKISRRIMKTSKQNL